MNILYDAAESCVKKTWFFQNFVSGLNENQSNIFKYKSYFQAFYDSTSLAFI